MVKRNPSLQEIKQAIRDKYAWPGGYPLYFIMGDEESLSIDSARENWREICAAYIAPHTLILPREWIVSGIDINYEHPALFCVHSGNRIESAYAEDEAENY